MIQRIQSLYFLLVIVLSALVFVLPIADFLSGSYVLHASGVQYASAELETVSVNSLLLMVILGFTILLTAFIMLKFGNRSLQLKLCRMNMLLNIVVLILIFYQVENVETLLNTQASYQMSAMFPVISIVLILLASRAIKKDELLVKSVDRIR